MSKRIAGIVIHNPDLHRLQQNISKIAPQVDKVVIQNNGIVNEEDFIRLVKSYDNISIIGNGENIGIAAALNNIAEYGYEHGAEWVLTLDQDSICGKELILNYEKYIEKEDVGLITCTITDRNFEYNKGKNVIGEKYINNCITSGSYMRLTSWKELGGFDEKLFIDHVDTDYCYRLGISGWKILQIEYNGLLHEVGSNTSRKKFFQKEFVVFNHSPFRCYYLIRNQIYFARKHKKTLGLRNALRHERTAWTRIIVYLLYEDDKLGKAVAWLKGIRDGYSMKIDNGNEEKYGRKKE